MARVEKVISSIWFAGLIVSILPLVIIGAVVESALYMNRER